MCVQMLMFRLGDQGRVPNTQSSAVHDDEVNMMLLENVEDSMQIGKLRDLLHKNLQGIDLANLDET